MSGKIVLISGAGGFIGRWSVPPLLAAGYEVHAVTSVAGCRAAPPELRGAVLHGVDLLHADAASALMHDVRPTHWLHFAWDTTPGLYWTSPENQRWLEASRHLLRCFVQNGGVRAVGAGSCAEYDWSRAGLCNEATSALADDPQAPPPSPYAACKLALQRDFQQLHAGGGASTAWGRVFFSFGPGERPERLAASVIVNILSGRHADCSHGRQVRSFLHVSDVGTAFAALLDGSTPGAVNIGSPEPLAIATLLRRIAEYVGRPDLLRLGVRGVTAGEPSMLVPDVTRLRDCVGWRPAFTLDEAIADTVAWWRARLPLHGMGNPS